MFYNAQVRATKIRSWECQHPNENKSQNTKKGIKAQYKPLSFPYNSAPWSCATETNLAWVGGFFSHQKKTIKPLLFVFKAKAMPTSNKFWFCGVLWGGFLLFRSTNRTEWLLFPECLLTRLNTRWGGWTSCSHNPCHKQKLSGTETPQKDENSNFSCHVIFQTLFLHGVHGAGKEREAITGMQKQKYI